MRCQTRSRIDGFRDALFVDWDLVDRPFHRRLSIGLGQARVMGASPGHNVTNYFRIY